MSAQPTRERWEELLPSFMLTKYGAESVQMCPALQVICKETSFSHKVIVKWWNTWAVLYRTLRTKLLIYNKKKRCLFIFPRVIVVSFFPLNFCSLRCFCTFKSTFLDSITRDPSPFRAVLTELVAMLSTTPQIIYTKSLMWCVAIKFCEDTGMYPIG